MARSLTFTLLIGLFLFGCWIAAGFALPDWQGLFHSGFGLLFGGGLALAFALIVGAMMPGAATGTDTRNGCLVAFVGLQPDGRRGSSGSAVPPARRTEIAERTRRALKEPHLPVSIFGPDQWSAKGWDWRTTDKNAPIKGETQNAAQSCLRKLGAPKPIVRAVTRDKDTAVFSSGDKALVLGVRLKKLHGFDLGPLEFPSKDLPQTPAVHTKTAQPAMAGKGPNIEIILGFWIHPEGSLVGDAVTVTDLRGPESIRDRLRSELDLEDAPTIVFDPDDWGQPPIHHAEDIRRNNILSEIVTSVTLKLGGLETDWTVSEPFLHGEFENLTFPASGRVLLFRGIKVPRNGLGKLGPMLDPPVYPEAAPDPDLPETFTCDICSDKTPGSQMRTVTSSDMKRLTGDGFLPTHLPAMVRDMADSDAELRTAWAVIVVSNHTDWGLCPRCDSEVRALL